ncbi:MAG: DUF1992 domain-containing protein [Terriglobia bacterium]
MSFEKVAEQKIREAMANGEFDDLACKGKPVDLSSYFEVHEDLRMAYSILKNANVLPVEIELLKEIEQLKEQARTCSDGPEKIQIEKSVNETLMKLNLLIDRHKRARRSGRI